MLENQVMKTRTRMNKREDKTKNKLDIMGVKRSRLLATALRYRKVEIESDTNSFLSL